MTPPSEDCKDPERNCPECAFKSPLFCLLSREELERVDKTRITVGFRPGETIKKQGTYLSHVLSVNAGLAKLYLEGPNGHNAIIRIVKPTHFIGGPGIYLDQRHHFSVSALTDTTVCFIDLGVFKELMDENQVFRHEVMKDFSRSILSVYNRLLLLTQKQMPGRMADTLIYLMDEIFLGKNFDMHLTKQDLADLSGMSKESAGKVLRQFTGEGIISLEETRIGILDPDKLRLISRTG